MMRRKPRPVERVRAEEPIPVTDDMIREIVLTVGRELGETFFPVGLFNRAVNKLKEFDLYMR